MSHYDDLGIATNATDEEIKRAYRDKAVLTHPDKGGDAAEFAKIARAYETLKDPDRRRLYDETGKDERLPFDLAVRDTILQGFSWALDTLGSDADIVEAVRGRLSEVNAELERSLKKAAALKKSLKAKRGKVKTKKRNAVNLFHLVIDQRLSTLNMQLSEQSHQLKLNKACLRVLKSYSDEWTAPATPRWSSGQTFKIDLTGWRI